MKAIITIGVSASGKTTWAREMQREKFHSEEKWSVVCRDDIRVHILDEKSLLKSYDGEGVEWESWNWKWENEVTKRYWAAIKRYSTKRFNLILADTNLNPKYRNTLIKELTENGYEVEIKEFPITIEEAWKRDARRKNGVGHDVIAKQYEQWLEYLHSSGRYEKYESNKNLKEAIIVDVDGTLAKMTNRGPYEWDKVGTDSVDYAVREVINSLATNYEIILMSGRDSVCYDQTKKWLNNNEVFFDQLLMRAEGDTRKDAVIKWELYQNHVKGKFNVFFVIDDRPAMTREWMNRGFKVFNVGNPYKEF